MLHGEISSGAVRITWPLAGSISASRSPGSETQTDASAAVRSHGRMSGVWATRCPRSAGGGKRRTRATRAGWWTPLRSALRWTRRAGELEATGSVARPDGAAEQPARATTTARPRLMVPRRRSAACDIQPFGVRSFAKRPCRQHATPAIQLNACSTTGSRHGECCALWLPWRPGRLHVRPVHGGPVHDRTDDDHQHRL